MSDVVARRYAQALIELSESEGALDAVGESLDRFLSLANAGDRQLAGALESPVFTSEERRAVLSKVLPKLSLHPLAVNILYLVNDKGRMALLPAIVRAYRDIADQRAGRVRALVETAEPLTPQLEIEVRAALEVMTGKTVIFESRVNPDLIGGIVARVGDKVYDGSIRSRLEQIRQSLLRSPTAEA